MDSLERIGSEIGRYQGRIDECKSQIGWLEKSYESLVEFKGVVERSRDDFSNQSQNKSNILGAVYSIAENNTVAKGYYDGMKGVLSEKGNKVIDIVYWALIAKIQNEINSTRNKIASCENEINSCYSSIADAQDEYDRELEKLNG